MSQENKLNRRNFLKTGAAGAASLAALANLPAKASAAENLAVPASVSARRIIPLNHGWLFTDQPAKDATSAKFDDRDFRRVTIPHANKLLPASGFSESEYTFVSVYRKHFRLPKDLRNQRVFVDFGGVMTASKVFLNGQFLGEYRGGYTPFSFELTRQINWNGDNVLAVEVDSTERKDIPPFGNLVDYLTFGGIYREVNLRVVNDVFIENVFAKPIDVLSNNRKLNIKVFLQGIEEDRAPARFSLRLNLIDIDTEKIVATKYQKNSKNNAEIELTDLEDIKLWDVNNPKLYKVQIGLEYFGLDMNLTVDRYETRIGFREARFTPEGFYLNGKHLKLRGLNRHQTYPYVGNAMPARIQRRDAEIIKKELKCNIVRTSHYPQSVHFLDACDELGLLVFEEIPGWQHVGDKDWQDLSVRYVEEMIRRDWNRPSIVLWGVRVNESGDNREFYTRTNNLARQLDDSRQTGGVRFRYNSERLEDVYTMNDFGFPLRPPNHPLYLITEFSGHMYPTKRADNVERIREHAHRHARVHDTIASDVKYAGGLGWCAFDYNTHDYFGSGDRICYHGVTDIYRIPKPAAGFYKSQCEPSEEIVLEPAFDWARGDENETFTNALVCSNCEKLKFYVGDRFVTEVEPDRKTYPNLKFAPFVANLHSAIGRGWDDLRIEGYIGGAKVIERRMSGKGVDRDFVIQADDKELAADGIDMTRVWFRVVDEFGNTRPFAQGVIQFAVENGEIVGDNPFALVGGGGAVWVRTTEKAGVIRLTARHPRFGAKTVEIRTVKTPLETI